MGNVQTHGGALPTVTLDESISFMRDDFRLNVSFQPKETATEAQVKREEKSVDKNRTVAE